MHFLSFFFFLVLCRHCVAVQMDVLKALMDKFGNQLDSWLTQDNRNMTLNVVRDSFLRKCKSDNERQHRKDILLVIELFASSFQLNDEARRFHFGPK